MAAPKAQTLQQRMGFADPDLTSPKHDELMLRLDEKMKTAVEQLLTKHSVKKIFDVYLPNYYYNDSEWNPPDETRLILPADIAIISKRWELPIMSGKFTVGFVDMAVTTEIRAIDKTFPNFKVLILFEVKSQINSLGELIRQIQHYRANASDLYSRLNFGFLMWVVASPDTRFVEILYQQGIHFLPMKA